MQLELDLSSLARFAWGIAMLTVLSSIAVVLHDDGFLVSDSDMPRSRSVCAPAAIRGFPSAMLLFGRRHAHRALPSRRRPSAASGTRSAVYLRLRDWCLVHLGLLRLSVCNLNCKRYYSTITNSFLGLIVTKLLHHTLCQP